MPYKDIENHKRTDALARQKSNKKTRAMCILLLGGKCVKCGFSDARALCIDHINGGGGGERKLFGGNYYNSVLKKIKLGNCDYQILCANCNAIKKIEAVEQKNKKYFDAG